MRPSVNGPAEAGYERQNASVEEYVQFEKNGEGFSTGEPCQECVLLRRYNAALLPLVQSGKDGHQAPLLLPLSIILHCERVPKTKLVAAMPLAADRCEDRGRDVGGR